MRSLAGDEITVLMSVDKSTGLLGAHRALSLSHGRLHGHLSPEVAEVVPCRCAAAADRLLSGGGCQRRLAGSRGGMAHATTASQPRANPREEPGAIAIALGGLLLLASLFVNWFQPGLTAWTVFEVWDLVLAALALWSVAAAARRLGILQRREGAWLAQDRWLLGPSAVAFVIVVASLINHPPPAIGHDPTLGIWLALVATVMMLLGAALAVARVSVAIELENRPQRAATPREAVPTRGPERTEPTRVIPNDGGGSRP